jgi:murein DD-endopeptidase MepM/ murein hydrolase activator NlpD
MKINSLKKFKSFFVQIIPEQTAAGIKSRRFSMGNIIFIIIAYTFIISFLGFVFFSVTPLGDIIFPPPSTLSKADYEKIEELNKKMIFLTKELESLKSTNERLRYAIMLGDSTLIDSITNKENNSINKKKSGGNIYAIIKQLFFDDKDTQSKSYYFYKPANGFISREFDPGKGHFGIDIVTKTGSPVFAAANGYIVFADYTTKDGYMMIINHPDNYSSVYKHCSTLIKKVRENVYQGELIALSGNTGETTTGPHLHFEIWMNGQPINPKSVIYNY